MEWYNNICASLFKIERKKRLILISDIEDESQLTSLSGSIAKRSKLIDIEKDVEKLK